MYKNYQICVVVPAYNEGSFIGNVLQTIPSFVDHIIVVDDGSIDNTYEVSSNFSDKRILVLRSLVNQGVGGATLCGYTKALEIGSQIIVKMDGDGQMPPEYLPALLDAIVEDGYVYAKGNRFLVGDSLTAMPRHRLLGNLVLTFMTKLASGYWHIFDPQNGYTAIKDEILRSLNFNSIHKRYFFENDMLIQLNFHRAPVKDVPVPARYGEEKSDVNPFKISFTFPFLLLQKFFWRIYQKYVLRDFSPIALFLFLGLALFVGGGVFGTYHWVKSIVTGHPASTGTVILAALPIILGFQLILQALVLDIQEAHK